MTLQHNLIMDTNKVKFHKGIREVERYGEQKFTRAIEQPQYVSEASQNGDQTEGVHERNEPY